MHQIKLGLFVFTICFCSGCLPFLFVLAAKKRQQGQAFLFGSLCLAFGMTYCKWWVLSGSHSLRITMLVLLLASLALSAFLTKRQKFHVNAKLQKLFVNFLVVTGIYFGGIAVLSFVPPFGMWNLYYQRTTSPDGRYEADLIYRDGLTFGYYFVALRPTRFSLFHIIDYPYMKVTELSDEGLTSISWQDANTLVVGYDSIAEFVQQDKRCKDITVVYQKQ